MVLIVCCHALGEDVPPLQLKEGVFRCIMQLFDCLLTEVHERCKKGLSLAKRLNSTLAFFCYDLLSVIEPRQVFELVCWKSHLSLSLSPWFFVIYAFEFWAFSDKRSSALPQHWSALFQVLPFDLLLVLLLTYLLSFFPVDLDIT